MIRVLLFGLIFYFIIRFIRKIVFAIINKPNSNFQRPPRPGKVTIKNMPDKGKVFNKDEGEYIDYKEVK